VRGQAPTKKRAVVLTPPTPPPPILTPQDADTGESDWWAELARTGDELLVEEFSKTAKWSKGDDVLTGDTLEQTRLDLFGFRFYSKKRGTSSAKTRDARDSYCEIVRGGRAWRLCDKSGVSLKKVGSLLLRSRPDVKAFWHKIVASGIDVAAVA
jgi:hypothetical protein